MKKYICFPVACPFIFQKPKDIASVFGEQATFFCDGVGTLHVSFKWYKGAHQLDDGDKYKLTNNNKNLTIINVNENDIGKYKCTLTGMYGETSAEASLTSATGRYWLYLLLILPFCS